MQKKSRLSLIRGFFQYLAAHPNSPLGLKQRMLSANPLPYKSLKNQLAGSPKPVFVKANFRDMIELPKQNQRFCS
jgi:hypothetical protein